MTKSHKAQVRVSELIKESDITEVSNFNGKIFMIFSCGKNLELSFDEVEYQAKEYDSEINRMLIEALKDDREGLISTIIDKSGDELERDDLISLAKESTHMLTDRLRGILTYEEENI